MTNKVFTSAQALKVVALTSVCMLALPAMAQTTKVSTGPIKPMSGNIEPFYGNIAAFSGNIEPFYGNIAPFWGNIEPFWGNIEPFAGNLEPFWGNIEPFSGIIAPSTIEPYWSKAGSQWKTIDTTLAGINAKTASNTSYDGAASQLKELIAGASGTWSAAVKAKTGKTFEEGFSNALLGKYGISLSDPSSLGKLDATKRGMFFLEFYDGLMQYSGGDRVDWWMKTANWTPSLTRTQGYGVDTTIGLLDFTVVGDTTVQQNIIKYDGLSNFSNGHGAAVASLMVGAHDRQGVMGIAPRASVIAYNPFDSTGTAGWADITKGISMLTSNRASIVNMSLGVPGYTLHPDWNGVFTNAAVASTAKNTVFVVAAGNEGKTQTQNVAWTAANPSLIIVGSVGVTGAISNFSNRPGEACLTIGGACAAGDRLKDRFIVAPGEMLLVSDDKGGVTRASGTSFAAPLVSGAIALLHDRWPWLTNFPKETTDIILKSAKDLGAPGVDPVYGVGMLDVTASQSPLDFSKLNWFESKDGKLSTVSVKSVVDKYSALKSATTWEKKDMYYYAFETVGDTKRDFAIPLSSKLIGQDVTTANGAQEKFQDYLRTRMDGWVASAAAAKAATSGAKFANFVSRGVPIANGVGADIALSLAPTPRQQGFKQQDEAYNSKLSFDTPRFGFAAGFGEGAATLNGRQGLTQGSDYGVDGGANPLLGLASGGAFSNWRLGVTERLSLAAGVTQRDVERDERTVGGFSDTAASRYRAEASHVSATYRLAPGLAINGAMTNLAEDSSLLGIQSLDETDLAGGSKSQGYSLGFDLTLSDGLTLSATGSAGRTRNNGAASSIAVGAEGLETSAYQMSLTKSDLFAAGDKARFTLLQPMFVERGAISYTGAQVIDRETGEIGLVTQSFDVSQDQRPIAAEMLYGRSALGGAADVTFFSRVEANTRSDVEGLSYIAGGRFRFAF